MTWLDELERVHAAGTEGPWQEECEREDGWIVTPQICAVSRNQGVFKSRETKTGGTAPTADVSKIVTSVNALPKLIKIIREYEEALDTLSRDPVFGEYARAALKKAEEIRGG